MTPSQKPQDGGATIVRYFNLYENSYISPDHNNRADADKCASPGRIACVRVEFKEGQFDD